MGHYRGELIDDGVLPPDEPERLDAYAMIQWETAGASGHVITLADRVEEELNAERDRHVFRVSTFFVRKGTRFETVIERFDEHYNATFDERANEALDRMFGRMGL